jgi:predicted alpha/beta superfamily hydrolase
MGGAASPWASGDFEMLRVGPRIGALVLAILLWSAPREASCQIAVVRTGPFEQAFEQSFLLHSEAVGRDFLVSVFAPPGPPPPPSAKLPVIYALDQGYDIAGPAVRTLGGVIESPFVVEVGYLPSDFRYRMTDLLFDKVHAGGVDEGGGGAAFQRFLLEELRPWIEARFPVDPARSILMGHSAAAFFAANVLAAKPTAFNGYILASPSFQYDPGLVSRLALISVASPTLVFISAGGAEKPTMIAGAKCGGRVAPPSGFRSHRPRTSVRWPGTRRILFDAAADSVPIPAPFDDARPVIRSASARAGRGASL